MVASRRAGKAGSCRTVEGPRHNPGRPGGSRRQHRNPQSWSSRCMVSLCSMAERVSSSAGCPELLISCNTCAGIDISVLPTPVTEPPPCLSREWWGKEEPWKIAAVASSPETAGATAANGRAMTRPMVRSLWSRRRRRHRQARRVAQVQNDPHGQQPEKRCRRKCRRWASRSLCALPQLIDYLCSRSVAVPNESGTRQPSLIWQPSVSGKNGMLGGRRPIKGTGLRRFPNDVFFRGSIPGPRPSPSIRSGDSSPRDKTHS